MKRKISFFAMNDYPVSKALGKHTRESKIENSTFIRYKDEAKSGHNIEFLLYNG